ncbi:NAD-dependent succinate-semialdehyde dehydrogenase [Actinoplanes sp. URMC 104]|uniref:NAD-dependent succinate-semialdehyde dehydrogenase n=1 Tax=Actinoplanes sp. URMC 104 TaxID=3423409 RepID=UPI003F1DD260
MTSSTVAAPTLPADPPLNPWIGGSAQRTATSIAVLNPATGRSIADVGDTEPAAIKAVVDAAADALPGWAATSPRHRSECLAQAFTLMRAESEGLARLITLENGKALADARAEVTYAAEFLRWFAEEAVRIGGAYGEAPAGGARTVVRRRPVGVSLLVTPWNFPAAMATRKIGPALAAGCTVVLKPASETPLTALALARLLERAGVPAGVVNVVPTSRSAAVVSALLADRRVRKLSFTGSTEVGRILLRQAADRIVNPSMELGGNAPFVVLPDADLDAAVAGALVAKFRNGGQACTAANCLFVHTDVVDEFTARFAAAVATLRVGPGLHDRTAIGPLISAAAVAGVADLVDEAVAHGAQVVHRTPDMPDEGFFYPPTVLRDVPSGSRLLASEIFGPVAPIVTWSSEQDLLTALDQSEYGLTGYIYSGDAAHAMRLAEQMDIGMIAVNRGTVSDPAAPFGGTRQSGLGREGGPDGIEAFLETQYLSVDWRTP